MAPGLPGTTAVRDGCSGVRRDALLEGLATFPSSLDDAVRSVAPSLAHDGEWGPVEVVRHLIAVEVDVHQVRLRDLAETTDPQWQRAEPGPWPGEPDLTLEQLIDRFAEARATTMRTVALLDQAGWARTGTHATLGVLDVAGLLVNALDHDLVHMADLSGR